MNDDARVKGWGQHVLHLATSYDFAVHKWFKDRWVHPDINIFYNYQLAGRNTFSTPYGGFGIGITFDW